MKKQSSIQLCVENDSCREEEDLSTVLGQCFPQSAYTSTSLSPRGGSGGGMIFHDHTHSFILKKIQGEEAFRRERRNAERWQEIRGNHTFLPAVLGIFPSVQAIFYQNHFERGRIVDPERDRDHLKTHVLHNLHMLHKAGIVHGDVKPTNLLLSEDGLSLQWIDLGSLRFRDSLTTYDDDLSGKSKAFLPPSLLQDSLILSLPHTTTFHDLCHLDLYAAHHFLGMSYPIEKTIETIQQRITDQFLLEN